MICTNFRFREVHISDLIKAHEGNEDNSDSDPLKIHWGKYNMMGGFVATTLQCQAQCRNSTDYNFPERPAIAEFFSRQPVMSVEVWFYLILKDFLIYNPCTCKNLGSNHMKMNLMSITPLYPILVSPASISYSSGKKNPAFSFGYVGHSCPEFKLANV
jgi:hypothetical protein